MWNFVSNAFIFIIVPLAVMHIYVYNGMPSVDRSLAVRR